MKNEERNQTIGGTSYTETSTNRTNSTEEDSSATNEDDLLDTEEGAAELRYLR